MEKIKEKIKEILDNYPNPNLGEALNIINQAEQDYIFPRVPRKVKLSEILKEIRNIWGYDRVDKDGENVFINSHNTINITISRNQIVFIDLNTHYLNQHVGIDKFKWLYKLWIAGTFIEVDV